MTQMLCFRMAWTGSARVWTLRGNRATVVFAPGRAEGMQKFMTLKKLSVGTENEGTLSKLFKFTFASFYWSAMVVYSYTEFKLIVSFLLNSKLRMYIHVISHYSQP